MSGVAIALQGVLSLLLVAALAYGVRLERKLRELREGQAGFAKAVGELDHAASRAESGLRALRESTEVAREELADRIDTARALTARLEAAASDAALAVKRLEAAQLSTPSSLGRWRDAPETPSAPRQERSAADAPSRAFVPEPRSAARRLRTDEDLFLDRPAAPVTVAPQPAPVVAAPADRLRQVADLLRGPTPAAGGRR